VRAGRPAASAAPSRPPFARRLTVAASTPPPLHNTEYHDEGYGDSSADVTPEAFYSPIDDATGAEGTYDDDDVPTASSRTRNDDDGVSNIDYARRMAKSVLDHVREFHGRKQTTSCVECGTAVSRDDFLVGELRCGHLKCKRCFMKNMWVCKECVNTIEDILKMLKTLRTFVTKTKRDAIHAINLMTLDIKSFKRGWYVKIVADTENQNLCSTCSCECSHKSASALMVCGHRLCYKCYHNCRNTDDCMVCYILRERMYDQAIKIVRELE
jgi:hypothetical protein